MQQYLVHSFCRGDGISECSFVSTGAAYLAIHVMGMYDWASVQDPTGRRTMIDRRESWVGIQNAPVGQFTVRICYIEILGEYNRLRLDGQDRHNYAHCHIQYLEIPATLGYSEVSAAEYAFISSEEFQKQPSPTDASYHAVEQIREATLTALQQIREGSGLIRKYSPFLQVGNLSTTLRLTGQIAERIVYHGLDFFREAWAQAHDQQKQKEDGEGKGEEEEKEREETEEEASFKRIQTTTVSESELPEEEEVLTSDPSARNTCQLL